MTLLFWFLKNYFQDLYDLNKSNTKYDASCLNRVYPLSLIVKLALQYESLILYLLCTRDLANAVQRSNMTNLRTKSQQYHLNENQYQAEKFLVLNSSHPSADCSCHSNVPFFFPVPTVLVTKYKGFLCNLFLLWE